MRPRLGLFCALAITFVSAREAQAQAPPDREVAREFANKGFELYQSGKYEQAITAFRDAERRFHAPTIVLMMAHAYDKIGRLLEARELYQQIVDEPLAHYAPSEFFGAQSQAKKDLAALEPRIPTLEIRISGAPLDDVKITVNGVAIPAFKLAKPLEQNPGTHVIVAAAAARDSKEQTIVLQEGVAEHMVIDLRAPGAPAPAPPVLLPSAPHRAVTKPTRALESPGSVDRASGGSIAPAMVAFGVGVVGIGVGAVTGGLTIGKVSILDERCAPDRVCSEQERSTFDEANRLSAASTIGFVVGGVGLAAGVTLLIVRPGGPPSLPANPRSALDRVTVLAGPAWLGIKGDF
jgi:hypothetical protein